LTPVWRTIKEARYNHFLRVFVFGFLYDYSNQGSSFYLKNYQFPTTLKQSLC